MNRDKLNQLIEREKASFIKTHPESAKLFQRAKKSLFGGVPMNWMAKWPGGFPLFITEANESHFIDVDGHQYIDLCLGDTGAMTGHSPKTVVSALANKLDIGFTTMLPNENAIWLGEELQKRFGLPFWQFALTATDANRFSIRLARLTTQRPKILCFNYCYHGSVDETFAVLKDGVVVSRHGNIGPAFNPALTTKVVEFNDIENLERALSQRDVACVITEPALTNIGIVHPEPGFHKSLRELTRKYGTYLIIDETHTICSGPGGYTKAYDLEPDILTLGKPIGSGIPAAVYGFSMEFSKALEHKIQVSTCDTGGIGGTLAGNALSLVAMKATLEHVLTEQAFSTMIPLASYFTEGVSSIIQEFDLPWHVTQLGCRAEYIFQKNPAKNGGEAAIHSDFAMDQLMHLYALNRGVLLTPFHNMALMSPSTTTDDIDKHTLIFKQAVLELLN
ncbi:aspartate aminotransferase family protein [Legionella waltersii]|uniref:Glutamate-1-semialdehyde-2,1-aminomutase n=1 Tax=Legionella waltersii TaxID=66969 RepID=A0A0W1AAV2_9GAMM|nr:aspartate aminotransferase family protein [Legionella waltersii]KTD78470.1 glutamate-1-semialdehyde-2,1-aminomutase [Legionella waltersii]SNV05886.1 glutamate-1-semialdehyde-2,1-aminomutase [Legionella waltersii]